MGKIVFIGDEVTGAGFRLAGVHVLTPSRETLPQVLADSQNASALILMTTQMASWLPHQSVQKLAQQRDPLVAIIPDTGQTDAFPDLGKLVRQALGIEA